MAEADAVVVIAGMEGALASLVGGLTPAPVVAVPTSAGYGASLQGVTALLAMLASCVPGLCVVGIDNGFGAAWAVARILGERRLAGARADCRLSPVRRDGLTTAWWHCFSGIAGDMALASLLDAGADLDEVTVGLRTPALPGWSLEAERTTRWRPGGHQAPGRGGP